MLIHPAKFELGVCASVLAVLGAGLGEPDGGFLRVPLGADPVLVHHADDVLGKGASTVSGPVEPSDRPSQAVGLAPQEDEIDGPEIGLGRGVSRVGQWLKDLLRGGVVPAPEGGLAILERPCQRGNRRNLPQQQGEGGGTEGSAHASFRGEAAAPWRAVLGEAIP